MTSVSTQIAYNPTIPTDCDGLTAFRKTGALGSGCGRKRPRLRRRALWIVAVILTSVLAPCHAPDAGQASATGTWQSLFVCPAWLVP